MSEFAYLYLDGLCIEMSAEEVDGLSQEVDRNRELGRVTLLSLNSGDGFAEIGPGASYAILRGRERPSDALLARYRDES